MDADDQVLIVFWMNLFSAGIALWLRLLLMVQFFQEVVYENSPGTLQIKIFICILLPSQVDATVDQLPEWESAMRIMSQESKGVILP